MPLNEIGRAQGRKLGEHFKKNQIYFDEAYSSDLSRALETAKLAIDMPIKIDKRLRERAFGTIEGQHVNTYRDEARKSGLKEKDLSYYTPQGAETLQEVNGRVKAFFAEKILPQIKTPNRKVLVVTHGGVIREFLRFFRDECRCDFFGMEIMKVTPNTGVNVFEIEVAENKKVRAKYVKVHDRAHLLEDENGNENSSQAFSQNADKNSSQGKSPAETQAQEVTLEAL